MRPRPRRYRMSVRCSRILAFALTAPTVLAAQILPVRTWGLREGLPHERVSALFEDSRGFLWVGTWEGLVRFDGDTFAPLPGAPSLRSPLAFVVAEDARGDIWFGAHSAGVARLAFARTVTAGAPRVELFPVGDDERSNSIEALVFTRDGGGGEDAWVATETGLYRRIDVEGAAPRFERRWAPGLVWSVQAVVQHDARTWILSAHECVELEGERVTVTPGPGDDPGYAVRGEPDAEGRVLIGTASGLFEFTPPGEWKPFAVDVPAGARVKATTIAADGKRWIGTTQGILRVHGDETLHLGRAQGLPSEAISDLLLDRAGRLWIGTFDAGLALLADETLASFRRVPDHEPMAVARLVRTPSGAILGATNAGGVFAVGPEGLALVPGSADPPFERTEGLLAMDRAGGAWLGTPEALWHVRDPERSFADGVERVLDGTCAGLVYEDARGRTWASGAPHTIYSRGPEGAFEPALDWPEVDDSVRTLLVDRDGRLWLGGWRGLWRCTGDERVEVRVDGSPPQARALLQDRRGRLWIGLRYGGLAWTDEPGAREPAFERVNTADGLPSDAVWDLCEAADGALWLATGRGLARIDPATSAVTTWTSADGLDGGTVTDVLVDDGGLVWAATSSGVTRLDPRERARSPAPPTVFVSALEIEGEPLDLPACGVLALDEVVLPPDRDTVVVRFGGVDLERGGDLRFQTRLGAGGEWSAPAAERSLHLARLAPGTYPFEVRSVARDGRTSDDVARVRFVRLAPVWQQPWFVGLALAGLLLAGWSVRRARLARRQALERVRSQIAADLHDEVGAGLAQISILSEVARREATPDVAAHLGEVAELARATRRSMSDLVWAIDPDKDHLSDVVARMRAATGQMLEPSGVEFSFRAPSDAELGRVGLGPEARRQLLSFFKEALTNAARHSRAARVGVALTVDDGELHLGVEDDGCGFDPAAANGAGHGLAGLRQRAQRLGARFELASAPGNGTRVALHLPVRA